MDVFALTATLSLQADNFFSGLTDAAEAMIQFAAASVEVGAGFDQSMAKVQAISGTTADGLDLLRQAALESGATTQYTAQQAADALTYMAMAGWKDEQMLAGLPAILDLAAASGGDLARTSDIVTDALTAFGMKAEDAAHFADILAAASSNSNTNVDMMGESFKYAASLAGTLGYSAEDTALALGLMANAGIKASMAGTSLRRIFTQLGGEISITGDNFGEVIVNMTNADGSMKPLRESLVELRAAFSGLTEEEKKNTAESLVGKTAMAGFLAIMNASEEDWNKLAAAIDNCAGAAKTMREIMTDNLAGDMMIWNSAVQDFQIALSDKLTPTIREFVQFGYESLQDFTAAFREGGLDSAIEVFEQFVTNGSQMLTDKLPEFQENGAKILNAISRGIEIASPTISLVLGTLGDMIGQFLSENAPTIVTTVSTIAKSLAPGLIAAIQGIFQGLGDALPEIWAGISSDFTGFIGGLLWQMEDSMPIVAHAIEGLLGIESKAAQEERILAEHMAAAQAAIAEASKEAENAVKASTNSMEAAYQNFLNLLKTGSPEIDVDGALTDLDNIETAIRSFMSDFTDPLKIGAKVDADEAKRELDSVLEYVYDLLDLNNISIETLASFSADGVEDLDYLIYQLIQLDEQSKEGKISTGEFIDKATPLITSLLTELGLLKAASDEDYTAEADFTDNATAGMEELIQTANSLPNGEISHTYSTHDQITNVITNYVETSTKASGSTSGATGGTGMFHARSMFGGTILQGATLFGFDAQGRPQIGGSEGPEAVVGVGSLNQQIREAVREGFSGVVGAIAQAVGGGEQKPMYIVLDTGALVGGIGPEMDAELARLGNWTAGGAA